MYEAGIGGKKNHVPTDMNQTGLYEQPVFDSTDITDNTRPREDET